MRKRHRPKRPRSPERAIANSSPPLIAAALSTQVTYQHTFVQACPLAQRERIHRSLRILSTSWLALVCIASVLDHPRQLSSSEPVRACLACTRNAYALRGAMQLRISERPPARKRLLKTAQQTFSLMHRSRMLESPCLRV